MLCYLKGVGVGIPVHKLKPAKKVCARHTNPTTSSMTSPTKRGFGPSTAHYEVLRVLGEGGFGKVWECVDVRAGGKQKWAVKQSKEASKQYPCQRTAYHAAVTGCVSSEIPVVAALVCTRCFASCCLPCLAVVSSCESGGWWEEAMRSHLP